MHKILMINEEKVALGDENNNLVRYQERPLVMKTLQWEIRWICSRMIPYQS